MAAPGTVWAPDTWDEAAWADGVWANLQVAPRSTLVFVVRVQQAMQCKVSIQPSLERKVGIQKSIRGVVRL